MIIVEGPDNAGKSTLITDLLALDPSLRILHRDRFKPHMNETIGSSYLNALMPPPDGDRHKHGCSIADRFMASECIYGHLYRGGCRMTAREHFVIKSILLSYGAFVVWCDPPDEIIRQTWSERLQLYDRDPIEIARAYRQRLTQIFHPIPVIKYDWSSPNAKNDRQYIINHHNVVLSEYHARLAWPVTACQEPADERE